MKGPAFIVVLVMLHLGILVPPGVSAGQPPRGTTGEDSASLHWVARKAVDAYESAAFRYSAPSMRPPASPATWGGMCESREGAARCLMGRDVVCPAWDKGRGIGGGLHCSGRSPDARDSARIYVEREKLLGTLDLVGSRLPGDAWVAGQRVYFLADAGHHARAIAAAEACQSLGQWCRLLAGFALQRAGRTKDAEPVFDAALAASAPEERCALADMTLLLDSALASTYRSLPCESAGRRALEERMWWLADPSWLAPGNDRRSEHFARGVDLRIQQAWRGYLDARPDAQYPFYSTSAEQLIVRGRSDSYWIEQPGLIRDRERSMSHDCAGDGIRLNPYPEPNTRWVQLGLGGSWTGNEGKYRWFTHCARTGTVSARFHFVPAAGAVTAPLAAPPNAWALFAGPAPGLAGIKAPYLDSKPHPLPSERYAPLYAPVVRSLDERQIGYVRRGDSALVVAAFDLEHDSAFASLLQDDSPRPAFTAGVITYDSIPAAGPATNPVMHVGSWTLGPRWTTTFAAPWDSLLVGAELLLAIDTSAPIAAHGRNRTDGVLARTRLGIAPPLKAGIARLRVSDLFFYDATNAGAPAPTALDEVLPLILGTTDLGSRKSVGLFWETYGSRADETVTVTLAITELERDRGFIGRVAAALGREQGKAAVHLTWEDQPPSNARAAATGRARTLVVDLGSLRPGTYAATLTLATRGESPVEVTRHFRVSDRGTR